MYKLYYRWKLALLNFINGIWSGFPLCCTLYYTRHDDGIKQLSLLRRVHDNRHCGYVRCPECCKNDRIIPERFLRNGALHLGDTYVKLNGVIPVYELGPEDYLA